MLNKTILNNVFFIEVELMLNNISNYFLPNYMYKKKQSEHGVDNYYMYLSET